MAKGYSISIASDTKAFLTGVQKGIIDPLEEAAEIIQDIGSEGSRDLDKLERSMKQAQAETEDVQQAFSDLQKEIRETGRKSRTDFADPVNRNAKRVSDQLDEVTGEAKQNAAEMFSSFDGSFESIADAAQGTLGGLVGGLKGVPAVAAVAAGAAGLGLVSAEIIKQTEKAEELKQNLVDAYRAAAEEGRTFIDEAAINMTALDIYSDTERRTAAFADAAALGIDPEQYIRALAGDVEAVNEAIARGEDKIGDFGTAWTTAIGFEGPRNVDTTVLGIVARLQGIRRTHEENQEGAQAYVEYMERSSREQSEQINRVRDAEQERFDALATRWAEVKDREPIAVPVNLEQPDIEKFRRNVSRALEKKSIDVFVNLRGRIGREPV